MLSNPSLRGMVKIGYTCTEVDNRQAQLSASTAIPTPFEIEHWEIVENPRALESFLHRKYSKARVNTGKEFFRVSADDVIEAMNLRVWGTTDFLKILPAMIHKGWELYQKYPDSWTQSY